MFFKIYVSWYCLWKAPLGKVNKVCMYRTHQNRRDRFMWVWYSLDLTDTYCVYVQVEKIDLFTPMAGNLAIWVKTTLLASRCQARPFSALKHFLSRWYCGKKQIDCGLALSVLTTIFVITVVKIIIFVVDSPGSTTFWPLWWWMTLSIRV